MLLHWRRLLAAWTKDNGHVTLGGMALAEYARDELLCWDADNPMPGRRERLRGAHGCVQPAQPPEPPATLKRSAQSSRSTQSPPT